MNTPIELSAKMLFENIVQLNPFTLLKRLSKNSIILCDAPIHSFFLDQNYDKSISNLFLHQEESVSGEIFLPHFKNLVVVSLTNEKVILDSLRNNHPNRNIMGFVSDVLICQATKVDIDDQGDSRVCPPIKHAYAIMCSARSGSTYLSELMGRNLGRPKPIENLRPYICFLYIHREKLNFNFQKWLDLSISSSVNKGIFSTKVIAQFLWRLEPVISEDDLQYVMSKINGMKMKFIFLIRNDKAEQAVSQYIAIHTKKWHIKGNEDLKSYEEKIEFVSYDFKSIKRLYEAMGNSDRRLEKLMNSLNFPFFYVTYEGLLADVESSISNIIHFLGIRHNTRKIKTATHIKKSFHSKNSELINMFKLDLK